MHEITFQRRRPQGARATALAMQLPGTVFEPAVASRLAWAVCLLPKARLRRLALHLGMLARAGALRQAIDAQTVAQLREVLGRQLYEFGMTRAPLIAPAALSPKPLLPPSEWTRALYADGVRTLLHMFKAHAMDLMPLLGRFVTLPLMELADVAQSSEEAAQATLFTSRVLREIEPGWYRSFELDARKT